MCVISVTGVRELKEKIEKTQERFRYLFQEEEYGEEEPVEEQQPAQGDEIEYINCSYNSQEESTAEDVARNDETEEYIENIIVDPTDHATYARKEDNGPCKGPPYTCQECGCKYATMQSFQYHLKTHSRKTKGKLLNCPYCMLDIVGMSKFKQHIECHLNKCNVCNWTFSNRSDLNDHLRLHQLQQRDPTATATTAPKAAEAKKRSFYCRVCKLTFADANLFNFHNKTHHEDRIPRIQNQGRVTKAKGTPSSKQPLYEVFLIQCDEQDGESQEQQ